MPGPRIARPEATSSGAWRLRLLGRPGSSPPTAAARSCCGRRTPPCSPSSPSPARSRAITSRRCSGRRRRPSRPTPACASACSACAARPAMTLVSSGSLMSLAPGVDHDLRVDARARSRVDEHAGRPNCSATSTSTTCPSSRPGCVPSVASGASSATRRWRAAAAQACEQSGAIARGLVYAQRLVESDPLAEHAQRGADAPALSARRPRRGDRRLRALRAAPEGRARHARRRPRRSSCWRRSSAAARRCRRAAPSCRRACCARRGWSAASASCAALDARVVGAPRVPARRRSGHRQEPPAAGVRVGSRRRRRRPRAAGRRRHRLRRAGAPAARRARRARRHARCGPRRQELALVLPELGAPVALAGAGAAAAAASRGRRDAGRRAVAPGSAPWSSTTCTSPTTRASSSCQALVAVATRSPRCTGASRSGPADAGARGRDDARARSRSRGRVETIALQPLDLAQLARADRVARRCPSSTSSGSRRRCSSTPAATRCSRSRP